MANFKTILMNWTLLIIKIVGTLHFLLVGIGMCGFGGDSAVFMYSNVIFLIALLWVIVSNHSKDACEAALCIDACSILLEILGLIVLFSAGIRVFVAPATKFCYILNLIIRPLSIVVLFIEWRNRKGGVVAVSKTVSSTSRSEARTTTAQV